ncbi:MAG: hypothetical protein IJW24_00425 [Clostridia bacterium]|nr:hypothetical protein [Clostridia bacterium]
MDSKKSAAISVCALLSIFLFSIIGSCFMSYLYEDEKVVVENPNIIVSSGITVTNEKGEQINKLMFSEVKLGLKPVTGELDSDTKIPVTVTDQNGSEGIFAKFKVKSASVCSFSIKNLQVTGNDKLELEKERKNIWMSIKEVDDSTCNFEGQSVKLGSLPASTEGLNFTLLFWLSSVASDEFESTTISFDVEIS